MYYKIACLLLLLALSLALPCGAQTPPLPAANKVGEQLVSLDLHNPTLADIVTVLGQKYNVNVVADAYADDAPSFGLQGNVKITNVPLKTALPKLAELFERDVEVVKGVVVLRHSRWYLRAAQEQFSAKHYNITWQSAGSVSIKRVPAPGTSSKTTVKPVSTTSATGKLGNDQATARLFSVEVNQASSHDVARQLSTITGWSILLDQTLTDRRLSAQLHNVTPGQIVEVMTWLLNARQRILIEQSNAQQQQEAALTKERSDHRTNRQKLSDALKPDLLNSLSQEQQAKLANNEMVEADLNSLSPGLRQRALDYINASIANLQNDAPGFPQPDMKRGLLLQIRPEPGLAINIIAHDAHGGRLGF